MHTVGDDEGDVLGLCDGPVDGECDGATVGAIVGETDGGTAWKVQLEGNPHRGYDMWFNVPASDPNHAVKQSLLQNDPLTAVQFRNPYDFTGTIHGSSVSQKLLATLRVVLLTAAEMPAAWKAFKGQVVSLRNELAVYRSLSGACKAKLDSFHTTIAEDEATVQQLLQQREQGKAVCYRRLCAVQIRLEDKLVLRDTISTLASMEESILAQGASESSN